MIPFIQGALPVLLSPRMANLAINCQNKPLMETAVLVESGRP